jgi:hypothetical protein
MPGEPWQEPQYATFFIFSACPRLGSHHATSPCCPCSTVRTALDDLTGGALQLTSRQSMCKIRAAASLLLCSVLAAQCRPIDFPTIHVAMCSTCYSAQAWLVGGYQLVVPAWPIYSYRHGRSLSNITHQYQSEAKSIPSW